jgi:hypothetical protein
MKIIFKIISTNLIKIIYRKVYKINKIIFYKNKYYIKFSRIGSKVFIYKTALEIIKDEALLNLFSPTDALLIGFLSIQ